MILNNHAFGLFKLIFILSFFIFNIGLTVYVKLLCKYTYFKNKKQFLQLFLLKIFLHLQCSTFETGEDGSPNNFAAGIFYAQALPIYIIRFRPPCECLMASLPVSGVERRESGTFSVSFPVLINFIVSFNALQK